MRSTGGEILELCPGVYHKYVTYEVRIKVLYVQMLKALYGILISPIIYCKKF